MIYVIRNNIAYVKTDIPFPCSNAAVVLGTNAIRLFYVGAVCDDGGIRMDGISVLSSTEDYGDVAVCFAVAVVSTFLQNCVGKVDMEHCGCAGCCALGCFVCSGKTMGEEK